MATNSSHCESRPASMEETFNGGRSSPKNFEPPTFLSRRDKHRSTKKKRSSSSNMTTEEIQYQRFVRDLKKDIQVQMIQYMREDRFDTRDSQAAKTDSSIRLLRTAVKSKRASSRIISHRTNDTETITSSLNQRQDPLLFIKQNEKKRLAADVRRIITGPAMKTFYMQFIRPSSNSQQQLPVPFEESFFNLSEQ